MRSEVRRSIPLLMILLAGARIGPATAQAPEETVPVANDETAERLVGLCRAWTAVRYLHPWMFTREIDWDAAFVGAVPAVRAADSAEEYRTAVADMLAVLGDPATELEAEETSSPPPEGLEGNGEPPPLLRHLDDGVVLLDLAGFQAASGGSALLRRVRSLDLGAELEGARNLIVDVRVPEGGFPGGDYSEWVLKELAGKLAPAEATGPSVRWPVHWGYRPQGGTTSGGYRSALVHSLPTVLVPADPERAPERTVVLVNDRTSLPEEVVALRAAGHAALVSEGPLADASTVRQISVELPGGLVAKVRAVERVSGAARLAAERVVEPRGTDASPGTAPALEAALALLREPWERPTGGETASARSLGRWRPDRRYPEMALPTAPYRMLAGCRLWGVIETFYPYLELIGDWEGSFRAAVPELLAADSEEAYVLAVRRLAAEVEDGHTTVWGPAVRRLIGSATLPFRWREIEGRWVITELRDLAVEDLTMGAVVHTVDWLEVDDLVARAWPFVTASTTESRRQRAADLALRGEPDTTVTLTVSGADDVRRQVTLRRGDPERPPEPSPDPPYRPVEGHPNLGYVDLTRLQVAQVDAMFEALAGTDGIVFDMRGYPHGTAWAIAPRINTKGAEVMARFRRREVSYESYEDLRAGYFFSQAMPKSDLPLYEGETVMLIDDRAISQSEHTALAFESAAGTRFVGTRTAGANGDVTFMVLPGDLQVYFTGHDVRHADGRQLQRVGIQPDVEVAPTIEGIRAGRDEVLERGVEVLLELIEDR